MNTPWVISFPASGPPRRQEDPEGEISLALLGWAAEAGGQVFTEGEWKHMGFWVRRTGRGQGAGEGPGGMGFSGVGFAISHLSPGHSLPAMAPKPGLAGPECASTSLQNPCSLLYRGSEARQTGLSLPHALAFR